MTKLRAFDHGDPAAPQRRPPKAPTPLRQSSPRRTSAIMQVQGRRTRGPSSCVPSITPTTNAVNNYKHTRWPNAVTPLSVRRAASKAALPLPPAPPPPSGKSYASKEVGLLSCQVRVSHFSSPPFSRDMCQPGKNEEASTKMGKRFVTRSF